MEKEKITKDEEINQKEIQDLIKEFEKLYKPYENKPIVSIYNENEKIKWNYSDEIVHHFKQEIDNVWQIIKMFQISSSLFNKNNYPLIKTLGIDTYTLGNEFIGKFFGYIPFIAKVVKCINFSEEKKISWFFNTPINEKFQITFNLYKVTEDNSTILMIKFKNSNIKIKKIFGLMLRAEEFFNQIEKKFENCGKDLFQFESGILNGNMEDIWEIILDCDKLNAIAPNNGCIAMVKFTNLKVGEKIEVPFNCEGNKGSFVIEVKHRDERKDWNKWIFVYEVSGISPCKLLGQTIVMQLLKINSSHCQFSIFTKFHESLPTEKLNELSKKKKYLLYSLKDYFENFYTPLNKKEEPGTNI